MFSDAPDDARWIVPIHHVVVHNLVTTAIQADEAQKQSTTGASGKLSDAATYLQSSVFSDTLRKGECTSALFTPLLPSHHHYSNSFTCFADVPCFGMGSSMSLYNPLCHSNVCSEPKPHISMLWLAMCKLPFLKA